MLHLRTMPIEVTGLALANRRYAACGLTKVSIAYGPRTQAAPRVARKPQTNAFTRVAQAGRRPAMT
jgi:hypothetical protein